MRIPTSIRHAWLLGLLAILVGCSEDPPIGPGDDDIADDDDDDTTDDDDLADGYPKVAMSIWSGASTAWIAEFDWVISSSLPWAAEAKALNPDLLLSVTLDFNQLPSGTGTPEEWIVREPDGSLIEAYGSDSWLGDTSDHCGLHEGQTYRDWIVDWSAGQDWSLLDGWATDGLWGDIGWLPDADIDRDGDHDSDDDDRWRDGRLALFEEVRQVIGDDILMNANAGHTEDYWGHGPDHLNGIAAEFFMVFSSWPNYLEHYALYAEHAVQPHTFFTVNHFRGDPDDGAESKENYRFMRFGLASALLYDGYYAYFDGEGSVGWDGQNEGVWVRYYDEYDVPLGQPLVDHAVITDEVFCRFFQGGAMILNGSTTDHTVTEADLQSAAASLGLDWDNIAGDDGHYYRFSGQQNPDYNDGAVFESITLQSKETWVGYEGPNRKGDGILLVRSPRQVVMAPLIVDTMTFVTSPGSSDAVLDGFDGTCGEFNSIIGFRTGYNYCSDANPYHGYAESDVGAGHTATFTARLVHDGEHDVYEYHPEMDAHGVSHTIHHADGTDVVEVDQRFDTEQWNLLGRYRFAAGQEATVVITDDAAGGMMVAADAVRFEWVGAE